MKDWDPMPAGAREEVTNSHLSSPPPPSENGVVSTPPPPPKDTVDASIPSALLYAKKKDSCELEEPRSPSVSEGRGGAPS